MLKGKVIELEDAIPELDGKRVRVVLEPLEEPRLSAAEQRELWDEWIEQGPQGPIEDASDTRFP